MGLIRKTLAVGTLGVVHGSSKKQRVAKATMKSSAATAAALRQQNAMAAAAVRQQNAIAAAAAQQQAEVAAATIRLAEQKAAEEREFRYATDPVFRKFVDDKNAKEEAARQAEAERVEAARRAELARIEEATQLKRLRRQQRLAAVRRGLTLVAVALLSIVVGVLVWTPQLVIGRIQHKPVERWMGRRLKLRRDS